MNVIPGEVLFLDRKEIESILTPKTVIDICEKTFKWINEGEIDQIHSEMLVVKSDSSEGVFLPYPAHIKPLGVVGVKWLSGYSSNPHKGLPFSMAVNVLNSAETGLPIAIMEGMSITSLRTAGHAAVGAKYLAKKNSEVVAINGCGREGRFHLRAMKELFPIKKVKAHDILKNAAENFKEEMELELDLSIELTGSVEELVKGSDIVCEVTTSKEPLIMAGWVEPGCHIAGTNPMAIDCELTSVANKWVVGSWKRDLQWIEPNKLYCISNIYASMDEVVAGKKFGRESDNEITLMTHYGMSAFDTANMFVAYETAVKNKVGKWLRLF